MKGPDAPWLASFVSQPTNEAWCRMFLGGHHGQHGVLAAVNARAPCSAKKLQPARIWHM
jgi:hypothetical protein